MSMQLVLLFLFFITASVSDMNTGKVRNKVILSFLFLGVLYYGVFLARGLIAQDPETLLELRFVGINFLLAFIVSFLVRSAGIWPAGDAKTYLVANLLIPLTCYRHIYFTFFPGFTLLINIFIAGIAYILLKSIVTFLAVTIPAVSVESAIKLYRHWKNKLSTEWGSYLKIISSYLIVYFIMNFITQVIFSETGSLSKIAPEIFVVMLFFLMRTVGNFINKYLKAINHLELYLSFIIFALFLNHWSMLETGRMLVNMSIGAIVFLCFYSAIQNGAEYYINRAQINTVDLHHFKEGDLPTKQFLDSLSPETRSQLAIPPEGISSENMMLILQEMARRPENERLITVYQPTPFVPIIFTGVLFTVITGISTVQYFKLLLFR